MPILQDALQAVIKTAIALAPDSFIPGGKPDPLIGHKHGLIGAPVSRIDGPLKVCGGATFAAEFPLEGLTYAALKYSTIARGRMTGIDTAAAEAAPGVVLVMTHRNAPPLKPPPVFMSQPKACGPDDAPLMQDDRIHWNGQPVALVLAETQEQADHAQSLIRVTYAEESPVTSLEAAKARGAEPGVFMGEPLKLAIHDAEAMLAAAPHKVDLRYTTPRHNHSPIELHGCTLAWEGDTLRVHDASQAVAHVTPVQSPPASCRRISCGHLWALKCGRRRTSAAAMLRSAAAASTTRAGVARPAVEEINRSSAIAGAA